MKQRHIALNLMCYDLVVTPASGDLLTNSDFSAGLTGWFADGDVTVAGPADSANLGEGSPFPGPPPGLLEQAFTLPADPISLSFEFSFDFSVGGPVGGFFDDLLQAELIATGKPELFTDSFGFASDAILAVDRFGVFENQGSIAAGTILDSLFTLDLTGLGLAAGDELTLTFLIFGEDDGFLSIGLADNVSVSVIRAPASVFLALAAFVPAGFWRARRSLIWFVKGRG